jgi:tetratricopeptide (TPR) repeat protein
MLKVLVLGLIIILVGCGGSSAEYDIRAEMVAQVEDEVEARKQEATRNFEEAERLFEEEKFAEAVVYYQKSIDALPTASAHLNLAVAYLFSGDKENARIAALAGLELAQKRGGESKKFESSLQKLLATLEE